MPLLGMQRKPEKSNILDLALEAFPETLEEARKQAANCRRCPLYLNATQTVFGEGPRHALVMFIGEQPGDKEDIAGRPFVGPAGKLFDQMLEEAGVDREKCYVTNAVKHFKNEPRGKFRLHKKPNAGEVEACRWWFKIEREVVRPKLFVALGATAALTLTGNGRDILKRRGSFEADDEGTPVLITVHPSSLLRTTDADAAAMARSAFRKDLRKITAKIPEAA